ncbi:MAG: hypothetical protein HY301_15035 [Verrucomicrobia bacterium]|nr:hypothetical protein [Verrucomicrobiota bacterium]
MRFPKIISATLLLALLVTGCRPRQEPSSELWLRWQFAGTATLAGQTNAPTWRELAALPASVQLREALTKRALATLLPALQPATNPPPDCADLLRPLLDLAALREHVFEIHGHDGAPATWLLAVHIEKEQNESVLQDRSHLKDEARVWEKNFRELVQRLHLPAPKKFNIRYGGGWYVTKPDKSFVDFLEIGKWVIVGTGTNRAPMLAAFERIEKTGRPAPELASNAWLRVEAAPAALAPWLPIPRNVGWQLLDVTATARGENLVLNGRLTLAADFTAALPAWRVPTNLVHDPLISFTALRGFGGWLGAQPEFKKLGLATAPEQAFVWAQTQIPFLTHWAAPVADASNALEKISANLPAVLDTNVLAAVRPQLAWSSNHTDLFWRGLPILVPHLTATTNAGGEFLHGGLFPSGPSTSPAPPELLAQLARPSLVYYDWEITEGRLGQWRQLMQFWQMVNLAPLRSPPLAQQQWLDALAPKLGNTITEISLTGPRELTFTRKSHAGLTGFELVQLARALDEFLAAGQPPLPRGPAFPIPAAP